jgi:sodium-dependent phosphate transporter
MDGSDWLLALGVIVASLMAYGIGANDSANAWATSVGSKAISCRNACLIGGFAELLGATSLGYGVSGTIQNVGGAVDNPECWACGGCDSKMSVYAVGMFAALIGAACFLLLATFTSMPVSTTHAIIGGVVGVSLVANKPSCLNWSFDGGLGSIVISWVISPLLSGGIAIAMYLILDKLITRSADPKSR